MSLRTSDIVVNHENIKQVVDLLFPRSLYAGFGVRKGSTWKPRMIVVAALLWAVAGTSTLSDLCRSAELTRLCSDKFTPTPRKKSSCA